MVLNVTNQCNLSCEYCYEYGEDKIVDTENGKQPKFMSEQTARESVDFMLKESGVTKWPTSLLRRRDAPELSGAAEDDRLRAAARRGAGQAGRLQPHHQRHAAQAGDHRVPRRDRVGVTISIDGPKEVQDKFRVFHNGTGSYDVVAPKIKELLKRHRSRPIRRAGDAHLREDGRSSDLSASHRGDRLLGSRFAPVTTAPNAGTRSAITGTTRCWGSFRDLAYEFLEASVENRHHGFSNVKETLEELHKGVSKAFPCGAGLGLLGVATDGERRTLSPLRRIRFPQARNGSRRHRPRRAANVSRVASRREQTDCSRCWARPLCSGGCYHEAHTRYGERLTPTCTTATGSAAWTDVWPENLRRARGPQSRVSRTVR